MLPACLDKTPAAGLPIHREDDRPIGRRWAALVVAALGLLSACTRHPAPEQFLAARGIAPVADTRFVICHGFACMFHTEVFLTAAEWAQVTAPFDPPAASAEGERRQIGQAVALLEQVVGRKTGTDADKGGLSYIAGGDPTQLDCMDETTNTTTYVTLLQKHGLLRWHEAGQPASRGFFLDARWYHETAVLVERVSGTEYAIDSWVDDNGKPPLIEPLEHWQWTWPGGVQTATQSPERSGSAPRP